MIDVLILAREFDIILTGTDQNAQEGTLRALAACEDPGDYLALAFGIAEAAAFALRAVDDPDRGHAREVPAERAVSNASILIAALARNDDATGTAIVAAALNAGSTTELLELMVAITYETRRILLLLHTRTADCPVCLAAELVPLPGRACAYPGSRPR